MSVDDSYTKSLLHFDGADASTTFTDESGKAWTRTGTPTISTTQKKFGSASGLFSGSTAYISTPSHTDFDFGSGDFTIDFWCRATAVGQSNGSVLLFRALNVTQFSPYIISQVYNSYNLTFASSSAAASWDICNVVAIGTMTVNQWAHIAIVRSGTNIYCFLNGVVGSTTAVSTKSLLANGQTFSVGGANYVSTYFAGNIDEFRVSKGIARWTGDFTPEIYPYPNYPTCYLQSRGRNRLSIGGVSTQNQII